MLQVTQKNFDDALKTDKPVLIDFWVGWWPGCVQLGPELEAAAAELGDKAVIAKSDIGDGDAKPLAAKLRFMSIPTLILFKNGKEVDRYSGFMEKKELVGFVSKHM